MYKRQLQPPPLAIGTPLVQVVGYRKTSNKRLRRLLEHWPQAPCVYLLPVYDNFTIYVNSQRLYLRVTAKETRSYL